MEPTGWMKDTFLRKSYTITNDKPACQKTLLRWQSKEFGPVRIIRHLNIFSERKRGNPVHRFVALDRKNKLLGELWYIPYKDHIKVQHLDSKDHNFGISSSLLTLLSAEKPKRMPLTVIPAAGKEKFYRHLGFVEAEGETKLNGNHLTGQGWQREKSGTVGKRKFFIK